MVETCFFFFSVVIHTISLNSSHVDCISLHCIPIRKIPQLVNFKIGKICLGSWFWKLQSMDAWLTVLEALVHGCLAHSFGGFRPWRLGSQFWRLQLLLGWWRGSISWQEHICGGSCSFPAEGRWKRFQYSLSPNRPYLFRILTPGMGWRPNFFNAAFGGHLGPWPWVITSAYALGSPCLWCDPVREIGAACTNSVA